MRNKNFYEMCISRIYKAIYGNDINVITVRNNEVYLNTKKLIKMSCFIVIKYYFCAPDFVVMLINDFL